MLLAQGDQIRLAWLTAGIDQLISVQQIDRLLRQIAAGNDNGRLMAHHSISPSFSMPAARSASSSQGARISP